jgi:hypothetical protein
MLRNIDEKIAHGTISKIFLSRITNSRSRSEITPCPCLQPNGVLHVECLAENSLAQCPQLFRVSLVARILFRGSNYAFPEVSRSFLCFYLVQITHQTR